jgi:hypothetical protein
VTEDLAEGTLVASMRRPGQTGEKCPINPWNPGGLVKRLRRCRGIAEPVPQFLQAVESDPLFMPVEIKPGDEAVYGGEFVLPLAKQPGQVPDLPVAGGQSGDGPYQPDFLKDLRVDHQAPQVRFRQLGQATGEILDGLGSPFACRTARRPLIVLVAHSEPPAGIEENRYRPLIGQADFHLGLEDPGGDR